MRFEEEVQALCLRGFICRETPHEVDRCLDAIETRYGKTVRRLVARKLVGR